MGRSTKRAAARTKAPEVGPAPAAPPLPADRQTWKASRADLWVVLGLAAAVVTIYARSLWYPFFDWDDPWAVSNNPQVKDGLSWEGVEWAFTNIRLFYWQPLTYLSHMLDMQLFGMRAGWHRWWNILLHAGTSALVFLVLRRLTGGFWRSALVAALFALHPLRVESVVWIAERKDALSAFFWMLAIWAYVGYVERGCRPGRYLLVAGAYALALMSKPMTVTLPLGLLVLDFWPLGRLRFGEKGSFLSRYLFPVWPRVKEKLPLLLMAAAVAAVTVIGNRQTGGTVSTEIIPVRLRVANMLAGYGTYLVKTVWPDPLAVFYPYTVPGIHHLAGGILLVGFFTWLALARIRRQPYLAAGWVWFLGVLFPVIGILQTGGQSTADRFAYVPSIGLLVAAVWWGAELAQRWPGAGRKLMWGCLLLLAALALKTWFQIGVWKDSLSVYQHAVRVVPGNEGMHRNLGTALARLGRVEEAVHHFQESLRLDPDKYWTHHSIGGLLVRLGRDHEAIGHFIEVLRYDPNDQPALRDLGFALMRQGRGAEAAALFTRLLSLKGSDREVSEALAKLPAPRPLEGVEPLLRRREEDQSAPGFSLRPTGFGLDWGWAAAVLAGIVGLACLQRGPGSGAAESWLARLAGSERRALLVAAGVPLLLRLVVLPFHPAPQPLFAQEFGHLLAAGTLAAGRLANPPLENWDHFQAPGISNEWTYHAAAEPGEALPMAAAVLAGMPAWFGVWLSCGLLGLVFYWMLRGWMSRRWALLGALLAAARLATTSYWMNSYWGGAVAAAGGALVLGAGLRLRRGGGLLNAGWLLAGLLLALQSRPLEAAAFALPLVILIVVRLALDRRWLLAAATVLGTVAAAASVPLVNARITGEPWLFPGGAYGGFAAGTPAAGSALPEFWKFFVGPVFTLPLLGAIRVWRDRRWVWAGLPLAAGLAVSCLDPGFRPHHAAALAAPLLLLIVAGLRRLRALARPARASGLFAFRAVCLLALAVTCAELLCPYIGRHNTPRGQVEASLRKAGGQHLVLVRYRLPGPRPVLHYNPAPALEAAPIVWARELGPAADAALVRGFPGRSYWLFDADLRPARLTAWSEGRRD